jgi:hypothetical protein
MAEEEVNTLLHETWTRSFAYEPFTGFKERPYKGRYVNVSENGFRYGSNQGSWPPSTNSFNVFLFGGSTAFGYGVSDEQTIASYLQEFLRSKMNIDVRVYNFGRGHYYSTHERILLEQLLTCGNVPDMAVFLDGLNDFCFVDNEPMFTEVFRQYVEDAGSTYGRQLFMRLLRRLPVCRAMTEFRGIPEDTRTPKTKDPKYDDKVALDRVISRYVTNKKMIEILAGSFGVRTIFVWQPVPTYGYGAKEYVFGGAGIGNHMYSKYGYIAMEEYRKVNNLGSNFLWSADIQRDATEPLYLDKVHYTAQFSKQIAGHIGDFICGQGLSVSRPIR